MASDKFAGIISHDPDPSPPGAQRKNKIGFHEYLASEVERLNVGRHSVDVAGAKKAGKCVIKYQRLHDSLYKALGSKEKPKNLGIKETRAAIRVFKTEWDIEVVLWMCREKRTFLSKELIRTGAPPRLFC